MKMSYYPGCTMEGTARDYAKSLEEVAKALEIELVELDDWNCCGASSAHSTNHGLDVRLSARNLSKAVDLGLDLVIPCPACFLRTRHADHALKQDAKKWDFDEYNPSFDIMTLTTMMAKPEVLEKIKTQVKRPLEGMKVVCYYGCLANRPPQLTGARNFENPDTMDSILRALGAEAIQWSYKTECCGGSLTVAKPDIVRGRVEEIIEAARRAGAVALVADCAMCQANLESRQADLSKMKPGFEPLPVYFVTELAAATFAEAGGAKWNKGHLVNADVINKYLGS